jgi:hypothetical protein
MESFLEPVEIVRRLQLKNGRAIRRPQPGDRVGFAFASKDRYSFTLQSLEALDAEGEFDLVWNDGSAEPGVPALAQNWRFKHARLVEFNAPVRGGADIAICLGLKRLLQRGYDYIGLIENDVVLKPGWFSTLMNLFNLAADDGLVCGAASVRGYASRVLEYRNGYSLDWASGAGMILFSRPAAELLFENYLRPVMTTHSIAAFYAQHFGIELESSEWAEYRQQAPIQTSLDWGYTPFLYEQGFASVNSIPTLATDLQFNVRTHLRTEYIDTCKNNSGLAHPRLSECRLDIEESKIQGTPY